MKVLLTGATGFVGTTILRRLLDRGDDVRVLIRPTSNLKNLEDLDCEHHIGDLKDRSSLAAAAFGCNALYHVAADYRIWTRNPDEMIQSNVAGTVNIMEAALNAGVEKIVYTSSVATLGINDDGALEDESTPSTLQSMVGPYKRSKYLAEMEVRRLINEEGLPATIVNPSAPIGPYDIKPTPTGRMVVQAAKGKIPVYVDSGLNVVHVDDVARGHILAFEKGEIGERYILGGENMTLKSILETIAKIVGRPLPKLQIPHNAVLPIAYLAESWARLTNGPEPMTTVDGISMAKKKMYFSSDKAKREIGYVHRSVHEGFEEAIKWFGDNGYLD